MNSDFNSWYKSKDALFHYTKTSSAIEILFKRKFKLSLLKNSNDPIEYKDMQFSMVTYNIDRKKTVPRLSKVSEGINQIKSECRVMCFCSNGKPKIIRKDGFPDEDELSHSKGWDRSRMWAQYAENHFGVCLAFSKEKLKELGEKLFGGMVSEADYVEYTSLEKLEQMIRPNIDGDRIKNGDIAGYAKEYVSKNFKKLFFLKPIDYRDESEYRLVVYDPKAKVKYIGIEPIIRGVIVGDKIPMVYSALIRHFCMKLNIKAKKVLWDSRGYVRLIDIKTELDYWHK